MIRFHRFRSYLRASAPPILLVGAAAWGLFLLLGSNPAWLGSARAFMPRSGPRLISMEPLPDMDGAECVLEPVNFTVDPAVEPLAFLPQSGSQERRTENASVRQSEAIGRSPLRVIRDKYPAYSAVAVDLKHDEVVTTDENLFQILVYDRKANTPPTAAMTEPKRIVGGLNTKIEFQCGLYIDPKNGDIYAVNNDTIDTLVIYSHDAKGDVPADRELQTPHGTYGIAVDEAREEMFFAVQHSNSVVVYRKSASGAESPIRLLQGDKTRLADPHGLALDATRNLIFVTNHGSMRLFGPGGRQGFQVLPTARENWPFERELAGSGKFFPPSITVYSRTAQGNSAPLRILEGAATHLNLPTGLAADPRRGELFVANDMENAVLVFSAEAEGNAAPIRVLKGPKTGLKNPTGLFVDAKNEELWVTNYGNHSVTVYPLQAAGDVAALRTIRSGPAQQPALMIGNPGAVAYDSKRKEILVPN